MSITPRIGDSVRDLGSVLPFPGTRALSQAPRAFECELRCRRQPRGRKEVSSGKASHVGAHAGATQVMAQRWAWRRVPAASYAVPWRRGNHQLWSTCCERSCAKTLVEQTLQTGDLTPSTSRRSRWCSVPEDQRRAWDDARGPRSAANCGQQPSATTDRRRIRDQSAPGACTSDCNVGDASRSRSAVRVAKRQSGACAWTRFICAREARTAENPRSIISRS
jgi:hypothetical protein